MAEQNENVPKTIVYTIPNMEQVNVRKDITYKAVDGGELKMDVYYPGEYQNGSRLPAVIFVHGDGPAEFLKDIKDSAQYTGWGQLTAASGMIAVTFTHRSSEQLSKISAVTSDIDDLIQFVCTHSESLGIDADALCLWTCSAGVPFGLRAVMRAGGHFVRCIVAYYGVMELKAYYDALKEAEKDAAEPIAPQLTRDDLDDLSAIEHLKQRPKEIAPMLIVRAGRDYPDLNKTIDRFVEEALAQNVNIDVLNHAEGQHAFDTRDATTRSREIIRATLEFMKTHLITESER
ncbi:MAG: hypothetical protein NVS4B7_15850 [Ktedonobacteraceae bacterium]